MYFEPSLAQNPSLRVPLTVPLDWRDRVNAELDSALDTLGRAGLAAFGETLAARLDAIRAEAGPAQWVDSILPWLQDHPAIAIARDRLTLPHTTPLPAARDRALRTRCLTIANAIDDTAIRQPRPHVMALASDRLTELNWSLAVTQDRIGRFIAADRNRMALRQIIASHGRRCASLVPLALSVRDILRGGAGTLGQFDCIYAADLVEQSPATLAALTNRLFDMLNPGGRLILGALGDATSASALAEATAGPLPVWRSAGAVNALAAGIPKAAMLSRAVLPTAAGDSWYLDLRRS